MIDSTKMQIKQDTKTKPIGNTEIWAEKWAEPAQATVSDDVHKQTKKDSKKP